MFSLGGSKLVMMVSFYMLDATELKNRHLLGARMPLFAHLSLDSFSLISLIYVTKSLSSLGKSMISSKYNLLLLCYINA